MISRTAGTALAAGLTATALTGCIGYNSTDWPPKYHATRTLVIPASAAEVSVEGDSQFGDLDLAAHAHPAPSYDDADQPFPSAGAGEVAMLAIVRSDREERLAGVELAPRWLGDTLILDIAWPDGKRRKNEGADWIVRVPEVGSVTGSFDFGDLTIIEPAGAIDLDADFGDITILTPHSNITLDADFGDIRIENAAGLVDINADFGDVDVSLTDDNPGPVSIEADFGDVALHAGPAFAGEIEMDTDFGKSRLVERGPNARTINANGSLSTTRGDGPRSSIRTDFGSVTVTVRE
ncbi:MAG: hypothetical protein RIB60_05580 [Phycisphaerales bacterium]